MVIGRPMSHMYICTTFVVLPQTWPYQAYAYCGLSFIWFGQHMITMVILMPAYNPLFPFNADPSRRREIGVSSVCPCTRLFQIAVGAYLLQIKCIC